ILRRMSSNSESLRPRLCSLEKGANGYGFHLHGEKGKIGQFIRLVEPDSAAEKSGLRAGDRLAFVNGMSVEGKQHSEVVAAIKAGGQETRLLVVDPETEDFFKRCRVTPTEAHLTGTDCPQATEKPAESELTGPAPGLPLQEAKESELTGPAPGLPLGLSLQEAKERAHQKRSSKRAPAMDWSKKNELFSNL
ncbi:Na(+)/H(+) exchange regulatory cofactor NHE-RF1, partial [Huso huso]